MAPLKLEMAITAFRGSVFDMIGSYLVKSSLGGHNSRMDVSPACRPVFQALGLDNGFCPPPSPAEASRSPGPLTKPSVADRQVRNKKGSRRTTSHPSKRGGLTAIEAEGARL